MDYDSEEEAIAVPPPQNYDTRAFKSRFKELVPGITHNLPEGYNMGEDGVDIYQFTSDLVEDYIKKPGMVVLVVIPADSNFQNAAALKLAKKYDPDGQRTLGVVTKVDKVPLENGQDSQQDSHGGKQRDESQAWVHCRAESFPREIEEKTSPDDINKKEKALFNSHPLLSKIRKDCRGFDVLSARIVDLQTQRLKELIPPTLRFLTQQIGTLERQLTELPPSSTSYEDCVLILTGILNEISKALEHLTTGERQGSSFFDRDDTTMFSICPRAWEIMDKTAESLRAAMPDFLGDDMATLLAKELVECRGSGLSNLIGGPAVHKLARRYLEKALQPNCASLTEQLSDLLRRVTEPLVTKIAAKYPLLRQELNSIIMEHLEECKSQTDTFLGTLARAHIRHVDTLNHYYMDTINIVKATERNPLQQPVKHIDDDIADFIKRKSQFVSNEEQTTRDHQISLHAYTKVVLKSFIDTIWHASYELLLHSFHDKLVSTLSKRLTGRDKANILVELMKEDSNIARERDYLTERLACFKKNIPKLKEIRFADTK